MNGQISWYSTNKLVCISIQWHLYRGLDGAPKSVLLHWFQKSYALKCHVNDFMLSFTTNWIKKRQRKSMKYRCMFMGRTLWAEHICVSSLYAFAMLQGIGRGQTRRSRSADFFFCFFRKKRLWRDRGLQTSKEFGIAWQLF